MAGALLLLACGGRVHAQAPAAEVSCEWTGRSVRVGRELAPFVEAGARPVCALAADLNGDGRGDWLLVLERVQPFARGQMEERKRALLIVVRDRTGAPRLAKRGDNAVLGSSSGGTMDPFVGVSAAAGTFELQFYGGSAWRWRQDFTFRYVPSRGTWELQEVREVRFNVIFGPSSTSRATFTSRDFGRLDIAEFNAGTWKDRIDSPDRP